jgi:large subunit ribosomal protein L29
MAREAFNFQDMTVDEAESKVTELKEELFNLRFRNAMRQLDNPLRIRYLRRDLARLKTALSEHRKGIRTLLGETDE